MRAQSLEPIVRVIEPASMQTGFVRFRNPTRAGATRELAVFIAQSHFDAFAVADIESGDAFALATRFALQWAYRGRQALFWTPRYAVQTVRDENLPFNPSRPFERRGSIHIGGTFEGAPLMLYATRFSAGRSARVPELRAVRSALRAATGAAILFADAPPHDAAFADLGFETVEGSSKDLLVAARGTAARATCARI